MKFAVPLLMISAATGLLFIFVKPQYAEVNVLRAQSAEYDHAIERAKDTVAKKDQLLAKFNSYNPEDIARLKKFLPDTVDPIQLIIDMNAIVVANQSKMEDIKVTVDAASAK